MTRARSETGDVPRSPRARTRTVSIANAFKSNAIEHDFEERYYSDMVGNVPFRTDHCKVQREAGQFGSIIMSVFEIFSKRRRELRGELPDVYTYDEIPQRLRVQIIHIWHDTIGTDRDYFNDYSGTRGVCEAIVEILCREYGVFTLIDPRGRERNYLSELRDFLLQEGDPERVLDAIELSFKFIDTVTREWDYLKRSNSSEQADDAVQELNARFRENGVGYQFDGGKIIRVDSELLHVEVVKPALGLLREPEYAGAQAEFLTAHEHYRHGRTKEAMADCLKAFESTMKVICSQRGWTHAPNATAKTLLQVLFDNGLIPTFWNQHFAALRSTLEAGVPTARNKLSGHGQGSQVVGVPEYLVAYVLHLTASAIVFLAEAQRALP
jgi:hypothetical protein